MTDMCRVFVVGNFSADLARRRRDDGTCYGTTTLCVGRSDLVAGQPVTTTVSIPIEVIGASRVASIAQQFGAGSRVLIEGHLELRSGEASQLLARLDGSGDVLVQVPRAHLVLVIDTILNAASAAPTAEAQQQPTHVAWQDVA